MWHSGSQFRRASQIPAAKTLGFRTCHSPKSSFPQPIIVFILHVQPPLFMQETAEPLRFSPAELVD
jgi:hypothetical protein